MNQGKKYTFIKIIQEKSLLIPQIQRDYVQHRTSYKVTESRNQLLGSLIDVVKGEKESINLNFIYGYSDFIYSEFSLDKSLKRFDCFVPIDGQQRLTTLYLLHLFVYAKAKNNNIDLLKNKLFYKTRETTQKFINKLTDKIPEIINNQNICDAIKNSSWYSSAWEFDVSVKSCLKVLEGIENKLDGFVEWDKAQANLNNISFMFLNITELGKPNELYIKMNSRGRQLTPFENFKSDLYGYIDKNFNDDQSFIAEFKKGLDNEWQENIWNWFGEKELSKRYTDELTKEIIHWIIINRKIADHKTEKDSLDIRNLKLPLEENVEDCYMIYPKESTPEKYWFNTYNIENSKTEIQDIYYTFNLFSKINKDLRNKKIFNTIIGTVNQKNKFSKNLNQYPARIRLFAITLYASKNTNGNDIDGENFMEWYRIVDNILNHSEIDTIDRFCKACKALQNLSEYSAELHEKLGELRKNPFSDEEYSDQQLYRYLNNFPNIKAEQIEEEIYKIKLMKTAGWEEVIKEAEAHEYFKGEIYFALYKVDTPEKFKNRWEKISSIFNDNQNDNLLKKHFIKNQIADIFPYTISDKHCMYYWNDKHHNNDWRGFLRKEKGRVAFNEFLTAYIDESTSLKKFVKSESNQTIFGDAMSEMFWKSLLQNDEMLSYMGYGRYLCENGHYYLLKSDDRSRGIDYKLYEGYLTLKNTYPDIALPEFTSKEDMFNMYLNVKGKKIIFDNGTFVIGDTRLNSEDVNVLKQEIEKAL